MENTEVKTKVMKRKLGAREFEGTLTIENGEYSYYYTFGAALGKKMTIGDVDKITKLTKVSQGLVSMVLQGKRWNEEVLRVAEIFAKRNVEMGFVKNVEEIICN